MSARTAVAAFPMRLAGNPYCELLYRHVAACGVPVEEGGELSPRWLLTRRHDVRVLHLHWPERHWRGPGGRVTARSAAAFAASLLLARALGYRLVWTVHNLLPHEPDPADRWLRWLLVRCADVVLQAEAARGALPLGRRRPRVIPHGHYVGWYPDTVSDAEARVRLGVGDARRVLLSFGQVRAYKGLGDLLAAFARLPDPGLRLVVAGAPVHAAEGEAVRAAAARDARIVPLLRFVPDDEVAVCFRAADVVVLPYREVCISGAAVLALSFGRPLLVPRRGALGELAAQGCALAYDDAAALPRALLDAAHADLAPLAARARAAAAALDWDAIGRAYARIFRGEEA